MNFHHLSSYGRGLDSLRETAPVSSGSKQQKELFQATLAKHFQIIQTFLQKINQLYNKNQDFELTINKLEDKIQKLQTNAKNIHYQFRTTHLMIDKKLNSMNSDYNLIHEAVKTMQIDNPIDCYLSSKNFINRSGRVKSRNGRKARKVNRQKSQAYKIAVLSSNQLNLSGKRQAENRLTLNSDESNSYKLTLNKQDSITCQNKNNSLKQKDGCNSQSSVGIDINPCVSIKTLRESDEQNHKIDRGKKKEVVLNELDWQESSLGDDFQWIKQYFQKQLEVANTLHAERLKKYGQEQKHQIQKLYIKIGQLRGQLLQKMIKPQKIDEKIAQIQKTLQTTQQQKTQQLKQQFQQSLQQFQKVLLSSNENYLSNFKEIDQKMITQKVQMDYFQVTIKNLTSSINQQLNKYQRSFANRGQTKKAIQFLDGKINKFIVEDSLVRSKKCVASDDPYLKINRCQSIKKIQFSQKSIRDIRDKLEQSQVFKINQTSMHQIQTEKKEEAKAKRVASQVITWKNQNLLESQNQKKLVRSTSKERQQIKRITVPQPKTSIKQWRQKVVKVLKKEDRRKRKVTFR